MTLLLAVGGFVVVWIWAWRTVYFSSIRKGSRPVLAHMLGFLLGVFPAQFLMTAVFVTFPPPTLPPAEPYKVYLLWGFFAVSVLGIVLLSRRKPSQPPSPGAADGPDKKEP